MNNNIDELKEKPVRILFVCTGNLCRSPMAEGLAHQKIVSIEESIRPATEIGSAGVSAYDGNSATPQAIQAMQELDIDISGHSSRELSHNILNAQDIILTMEQVQLDRTVAMLEIINSKIPAFLFLKFAEAARVVICRNGGTEPDFGLHDRLEHLSSVTRVIQRNEAWELEERDYEVADPIGFGVDEYRKVAAILGGALDDIFEALLSSYR